MANEKVTFKKVKKYVPLYVMMIPGLLYLIINNYMPMPGLVIAFKTYSAKKGIYGSPWCGFANFKYLFATSDAWVITRNTILYNVGTDLQSEKILPVGDPAPPSDFYCYHCLPCLRIPVC